MTEILEIPVISLVSKPESESDFESLIKGEIDRNYEGFRHIEKTIKDNKSIYFYMLGNAVETDDYSVWDRIIPKAPFCLVLFDWDHTDFDRIITIFKNRYQTPLNFITFSAPPSSQKITSEILKQGEIRVIFAEKNSEEGIEGLLAEAIHFSYPKLSDGN
ncbi:MAG: hypothetical protein JXR46_08715 [Calditrichaceae bacterium]|nr:hypothetical protein [Calditrichaceae bacterium]MBN2709114.1 hypothetical protein [Calditrichaceae bacterium]RQV96070.1 MAG: hypothetical protein EH224_05020 [Calditrichota bacterium]